MLRDGAAIVRAMFREVGAFLVTPSAKRRYSKAGPLHVWKAKREFQIRFLKEVELQPDHYLLDIGCGSLRGGIPIIEYLEKGHYYGVDVRAEVLAEGRRELCDANLEHKEPVLSVVESLSSLNLKLEFDYIWAYSVLIHMADDTLDGCLRFVNRHLNNSGSFYANVGIGQRRDTFLGLGWQGFPWVWRSWGFYKDTASRNGLHVTDMGTLKSLGDYISGVRAIDEEYRMLRFRKLNSSLRIS